MFDDNNPISGNMQTTIRPQQVLNRSAVSQEPQQPVVSHQSLEQMQQRQAAGKACPYCGAINEPEAMFCAQCGQPISKANCPHCGAEMYVLIAVPTWRVMRLIVQNVVVLVVVWYAPPVIR